MIQDSSRSAFVFAIIVIGLLTGALLAPWLEYDYSSGRGTSPDGPYGDDPRVQRAEHTLGALPGSGDLEPEGDRTVQLVIFYGLLAGGLCLLIAAAGDLPKLHALVSRRVSLSLYVAAWATTMATLLVGWFWLPSTLSGYGVEGPFTHILVEPDGYTRTTLSFGWILGGLAFLGIPVAWIQKFQAGADDPTGVEVYRV